MRKNTDESVQYERPAIEQRTSLARPLVGAGSGKKKN